jgi:hypothetical protein
VVPQQGFIRFTDNAQDGKAYKRIVHKFSGDAGAESQERSVRLAKDTPENPQFRPVSAKRQKKRYVCYESRHLTFVGQ